MNRKQKILTLLAVENDWLTATQLAHLLQVSTRTIRLDIKQLREASPHESIVTSKKYGYKLMHAPQEHEQLPKFTNNYDRKHRLLALWHQFYFNSEVDVYSFAEQFFVSDSTLINDVTALKTELSHFYQGQCQVQRDGAVFKLATTQPRPPEQFYHFALKHLQVERLEEFASVFTTIDLQQVYRCWAEVIYAAKPQYQALSLIELSVEVAVIIAMAEGATRSQVEVSGECEAVVAQLASHLQTLLQVHLSAAQKVMIAAKLMAIASFGAYEQQLRTTMALDANLVAKSTQAFARFYIPLNEYTKTTPNLLAQFFCHLQLARERQRQGFYTMNPLLGQLRHRHQLLFEIAKRALREIGLEFDENECAYIVTYLQLMLATEINRQAQQLHVSVIVTNSYSNGLFIQRCVQTYAQIGDQCDLIRQIPQQLPKSDVIFSTHNLARQYPQVIMLDKQFDVAQQLKLKVAIKQGREQKCQAYFQQLGSNFEVVQAYERTHPRPFSIGAAAGQPTKQQFQQAVLYQYCYEDLQAQGLIGLTTDMQCVIAKMCDYYGLKEA